MKPSHSEPTTIRCLPPFEVGRFIDYDGKPALISTLTDVSARKTAETEIARQRDALHQSGIGLSLCHSVVTAHGGTITTDDASGGGALFRVCLPLPETADADKHDPESTPTPAGPERILIVDDECEIAEMLAEILDAAGYRSIITGSGHQALALLAEQSVDLILSDIRMPDLDGPGLFRELQINYPDLAERLIFVTGDILSGPTAIKLNRQIPVIEKPFKPSEVKQAVAERLAWLSNRS